MSTRQSSDSASHSHSHSQGHNVAVSTMETADRCNAGRSALSKVSYTLVWCTMATDCAPCLLLVSGSGSFLCLDARTNG